jgi:hypothetical protein
VKRLGLSRRKFIASAAVAGGSAILSTRLSAVPFQHPVVNTLLKDGKPVSRERVSWKVQPFPAKQVWLGEGPCKHAMEADQQYLHSLPVDRLLHTFRINAGIPSAAQPLGGWEAPDCELRGHYTGGHIFQRSRSCMPAPAMRRPPVERLQDANNLCCPCCRGRAASHSRRQRRQVLEPARLGG